MNYTIVVNALPSGMIELCFILSGTSVVRYEVTREEAIRLIGRTAGALL